LSEKDLFKKIIMFYLSKNEKLQMGHERNYQKIFVISSSQ